MVTAKLLGSWGGLFVVVAADIFFSGTPPPQDY